jgi:hypothetical protein
MTDRVTLTEGGHVDITLPDGLTVRVSARRHSDGTPFVALGGVDCDLEGEMPGEYYPVAR